MGARRSVLPASLLALSCAARPTPAPHTESAPAAELVIRHARVLTMNPGAPRGEAVAVRGERIVAVGSDEQVGAWIGPRTRVVEAGGGSLLPGFDDAHVHMMAGGLSLSQVAAADATGATDLARRVAEAAARAPKGAWIRGFGWDETRWAPPTLPSRSDLDAVAPDNPVALSRVDGHELVVSSLALVRAHIDSSGLEHAPEGVVRDASGAPTGILRDAAMAAVLDAIPSETHAERRAAIEHALALAAEHGITSVQDMATPRDALAIYEELAGEGRLTARVYVVPVLEPLGVTPALAPTARAQSDPARLRVAARKAFADGSLGAGTAYFFDPFDDEPGRRGALAPDMASRPELVARLLRADDARLQLCIHAIGDAAIAATLDVYGDLEQARGRRDRRPRIEHAQHVAANDFARMASLGVIASVQPAHAIDDGRWAERRIGRDRASRSYALRSFLDHGVRVAFGTDWPVAPLDPMLTLAAATTRATLDGKHPGGWFPEQRLTLAEALAAYTTGSAFAERAEGDKGSIEPGKLADLVLLDRDLTTTDLAHLPDARVVSTWVGGRAVFNRRAAPPAPVAAP